MELIAGAVLGFLSGLGVGGGSLLILYLTLVIGMDPATARGINLLFFLPCAAIAAWLRWREGAVRPRWVLPAAIAGSLAAAVLTQLGRRMDTTLLQKLFGGLLLLTGIRELTYRKRL